MKWSVVVLLVLGVVAAVCAALLVVSIQGSGDRPVAIPIEPNAAGEGTYVVAGRDLEMWTVVENDAVEMVTSKNPPPGAYSQPGKVLGQVMRKRLEKGKAFDPSCFTKEGTGVVLAGALDPGKRAVSIPIADSGGVGSMLYPGCMVDVLAVMELRDDGGLGNQPMSMTLLQGITVLAVGDMTVVTPPQPEESGRLVQKAPPSTVTLLVDTKQAEMLYLARQRGSVTIALRNPMDTKAVGTQGTRMPNLSPAFQAAEDRALERLRAQQRLAEEEAARQREKSEYDMERVRNDIELARKQAEIANIELDRKKLESERAAELTVKPQWETRVIRGGAEAVMKFDLPDEKRGR